MRRRASFESAIAIASIGAAELHAEHVGAEFENQSSRREGRG